MTESRRELPNKRKHDDGTDDYFTNRRKRNRNNVSKNTITTYFINSSLKSSIRVYKFPKNTRDSTIKSWFKQFGGVDIFWVDDNSCVVRLADAELVSKALETLKDEKDFKVEKFMDFLNRPEADHPSIERFYFKMKVALEKKQKEEKQHNREDIHLEKEEKKMERGYTKGF